MSEAAQHIARYNELAEREMRRLMHMRKDAIQVELIIDAEAHLEAADDGDYTIHRYSLTVYALAHATTLLEHAFKTIQALEADQSQLWQESA